VPPGLRYADGFALAYEEESPLVRPAMDVDPPSSHGFIVVVFFTVKLLINGKVQQTYSPTPSILAPIVYVFFYSKGFKHMGKSNKHS